MFDKFNLHLTNRCNYHCTYCFGKFNGDSLSMNHAKLIISNIADYFKSEKITTGAINFAGGEPLLYPHLDELIDYTADLGIKVSLVTNGSLLTSERIRQLKEKVACIGIIIDSLSPETNHSIGRCSQVQTLSLAQWKSIADAIHACGIKLKINTAVSQYNIGEDFLPLYEALRPDRIKFLQMHIVHGVNDRATSQMISRNAFHQFCNQYKNLEKQTELICEESGQMENSYLMIDPNGDFLLNDNGKYHPLGSCLTNLISDILTKAPLSREKFESRYEGGAHNV